MRNRPGREAYAKLYDALKAVANGRSATSVPGGPMQLEPQLEEELPGNVARMNQKKFNW